MIYGDGAVVKAMDHMIYALGAWYTPTPSFDEFEMSMKKMCNMHATYIHVNNIREMSFSANFCSIRLKTLLPLLPGIELPIGLRKQGIDPTRSNPTQKY